MGREHLKGQVYTSEYAKEGSVHFTHPSLSFPRLPPWSFSCSVFARGVKNQILKSSSSNETTPACGLVIFSSNFIRSEKRIDDLITLSASG